MTFYFSTFLSERIDNTILECNMSGYIQTLIASFLAIIKQTSINVFDTLGFKGILYFHGNPIKQFNKDLASA